VVKSLYRPLDILTLHNHGPIKCAENCERIVVNEVDGLLHHYRTLDPVADKLLLKKEHITIDRTMWKWKNKLILRTKKVLLDLGLIT